MPNVIINTDNLPKGTERDRLRALICKERLLVAGIKDVRPLFEFQFYPVDNKTWRDTYSARQPDEGIVDRLEILVQDIEKGEVKKAVNNPEAAAPTFGRQAQKEAS